jgi:hypothetical protein
MKGLTAKLLMMMLMDLTRTYNTYFQYFLMFFLGSTSTDGFGKTGVNPQDCTFNEYRYNLYISGSARICLFSLPGPLPPPTTTCHTRAECGECEQVQYIPHTTEVQQGEGMDAHLYTVVCKIVSFFVF